MCCSFTDNELTFIANKLGKIFAFTTVSLFLLKFGPNFAASALTLLFTEPRS